MPVLYSYRNQREVAQGIKRAYKELGLKRGDIFIVNDNDFAFLQYAQEANLYLPYCRRHQNCGTGNIFLYA